MTRDEIARKLDEIGARPGYPANLGFLADARRLAEMLPDAAVSTISISEDQNRDDTPNGCVVFLWSYHVPHSYLSSGISFVTDGAGGFTVNFMPIYVERHSVTWQPGYRPGIINIHAPGCRETVASLFDVYFRSNEEEMRKFQDQHPEIPEFS